MIRSRPSTFDLRLSLPWLYWALALSQAAHSIEEVATGLWRWISLVTEEIHAQTGWTPVLAMPEQTFVIANMAIITVMLAFSPFVFLNHAWAWKTATMLAVIETINGAGHITVALVTGGYFSGCIAGIGLVVFGVSIWGRKFIWKETK